MDELRFGRQFRALRIRQRRRQSDVSKASGLSRSSIASIDRGQLAGVTLGSLRKATSALGADVDIFLRWRGERLDRLLDEDHAAVVETFVQRLRRSGWAVDVEVSFSIWGERGSIDVLAFYPASAALLVVEVKSVVPDSQAMLHGLDRKSRLAPHLAKERGWLIGSVNGLLVIADSATSRRRIARLAATYDVALPDRGATVRGWLQAPSGRISGLLFLSIDNHGGRIVEPADRSGFAVHGDRNRAQVTAWPAVEPPGSRPRTRPADTVIMAVIWRPGRAAADGRGASCGD